MLICQIPILVHNRGGLVLSRVPVLCTRDGWHCQRLYLGEGLACGVSVLSPHFPQA